MPGLGELGGPGLPDRVRITRGTFESHTIMEQDRFGRFIKEAERAGDTLMEDIAKSMERRAKRYAPVRTGRLRRSIQGLLFKNNREARLYSDAPYAEIMEEGSRPHLIHGVRASFDWRGGRFNWKDFRYGPVKPGRKGYQNWTFAHGATVRHPGTKPHWFFKRAFEETFIEARALMRKAYGGIR